MSGSRDSVVSSTVLAVITIAALALALFVPLASPQRAIALGMLAAGLVWLAALHWLVRRTAEGWKRLAPSLPLSLDLVSSLVVVGTGFWVQRVGSPEHDTIGAFAAGAAAGAVLYAALSLTARWVWGDFQRRRRGSHREPARPPARRCI